MSELPKGWHLSILSNAGKWGSGGTPSRQQPKYFGGKIPWIKSGDLCDGLITSVDETITEEALKNSSAKLLPAGTVSIALYGATIGKLGILTFEAATNQACANCIVDERLINSRYLFHYLRSQRKALVDKGQGGAQPNISQDILKAHALPIAPLNEQKRIVAKLDELLPKVEACKQRLEKIPTILKRFRQSVLAAAVSGKLTEEWRKTNSIDFSSTWTEVSISKIAATIDYGYTASAENEGNVKFLRITDIQDYQVDWNSVPFCNLDPKRETRFILSPGDIVFARTGATTGKSYLIRDCPKAVFASYLIRVKANLDLVDPSYLNIFFGSPEYWTQIYDGISGSAQPSFNASKLGDVTLLLPSIREQCEIVRNVESWFRLVDNLVERYSKGLSYVNKMGDAVLSKAFSGSLVLQDPTDEAASTLLERLKALSATSTNGSKPKRTRKTKDQDASASA